MSFMKTGAGKSVLPVWA